MSHVNVNYIVGKEREMLSCCSSICISVYKVNKKIEFNILCQWSDTSVKIKLI
jgi:hypothetical protein